jgi:3-oxoadipate enol-lactonase
MPTISLAEGLSLHCAVDDYLWPWDQPTPVLMMHGFARNASFWNRWVPPVAESRRIYRPDLLGCGASDVPGASYRYTPDKIESQVLAVLDGLSLARVHWVGESSGGIIGLVLAAAHPERIASLVLCNVESPGGLSPPGAPRSVREPLGSYGSRCSAVSMAELPVGEECWIYSV